MAKLGPDSALRCVAQQQKKFHKPGMNRALQHVATKVLYQLFSDVHGKKMMFIWRCFSICVDLMRVITDNSRGQILAMKNADTSFELLDLASGRLEEENMEALINISSAL